jgi:hypothetical protein
MSKFGQVIARKADKPDKLTVFLQEAQAKMVFDNSSYKKQARHGEI